MDGLKRYVNDDPFRVDGDKNMRLLAFAFTIVFVWTGPHINNQRESAFLLRLSVTSSVKEIPLKYLQLKELLIF